MQDEFVPKDPTAGNPIDGRMDNLESRLSAIEADSTSRALSAEDKYNRLLYHEVFQRICMRYAAIFIAIIVITIMVLFACNVLSRYFFGPFIFIPPAIAVAIFVAPIVSVSAITIMLMIGAFRRFKDDDIEQVNAQAIVEAAKFGLSN